MSHIFGEHFSFFGSSFSSKTFIKNDDPEHKTRVNHIDHNRSNNDANNLEWITPKAPDIAKIVGTTEGNIRNIIKGRNWKWISKIILLLLVEEQNHWKSGCLSNLCVS